MNARVEVPDHGALCRHGESYAEFAYSQMHGIGEAEAKRRLPAFVAMVEATARATAAMEGASNVDEFVEVAVHGFKVRAGELKIMGAREPLTFREAFHRRRLHEALKLLDAIPVGRVTGQYLASLGVDPATVAAKCGRFIVLPGHHPSIADWVIKYDHNVSHVIAEIRDFDGETPVDLAVWPIDGPDEWYTGFGESTLLGHSNIYSPSEEPLCVHRTPEAWLRAGCSGVVVTSDVGAWRDLQHWRGFLAVEDVDHARELAGLIAHVVDPRKIIIRDAA